MFLAAGLRGLLSISSAMCDGGGILLPLKLKQISLVSHYLVKLIQLGKNPRGLKSLGLAKSRILIWTKKGSE